LRIVQAQFSRIRLGRELGISPDSLHLDIGRFDNGPPLLDFSPVVGEQAFWRLLLTRCDLVANISITLLHCWVAQGLNDSGVEPGNDRLRRSFWSTKTEIEDLIRQLLPW